MNVRAVHAALDGHKNTPENRALPVYELDGYRREVIMPHQIVPICSAIASVMSETPCSSGPARKLRRVWDVRGGGMNVRAVHAALDGHKNTPENRALPVYELDGYRREVNP